MARTWVAISLGLLAAVGVARAEVMAEALPAEQIQLYAPIAKQLIQEQFPNPPIKVDSDPARTFGYHVQEKIGVFVMPDRAISPAAVKDPGDKSVPVALLVTKDLSIREKDTPVPPTRLAVADLNGQIKLPVFYVAVRAQGDDRIVDVYSREAKPLASIAAKKLAAAPDEPVGLKLSGVDLEKKQANAILTVAGGYEATLPLGVIEP
ncbi:MAG: hypothetical protein FJX77_07355 [Armatimonadetes bacterium]|nr:hypothetical protein [Armatimonadota bacterium]